MREKFNMYTLTRPRLRKYIGWVIVVIGFIALVTPFTPGGFLFFVGLEILGLRMIFTDKFKCLFPRIDAYIRSYMEKKSTSKKDHTEPMKTPKPIHS